MVGTYISRWFCTSFSYLRNNLLFFLVISVAATYMCRSGVFDKFGPSKTYIFTVLMAAVWQGLFNSVLLFYSHSDQILDELHKFLSVRTYIASNAIIQAILCVAEAFEACTVMCLFFGFNEGVTILGSGLEYFITFFLILFSADMLGLAVGVSTAKVNTIMTAIPVVLIAQFLFSGCLLELDGMMKIIANITTAKWGFNALGTISDLNSLLIPGTEQNVFRHTTGHLLSCWGDLILLSSVIILTAGGLLYRRLLRGEDK